MESGQPADRARVQRFLENILATEDHELDCHAVMQVIGRYVEVEVQGESPAAVEPGVPQHLRNCGHCAEMYATLKELAALEAAGDLPSVDNLWADLTSAVPAAAALEPNGSVQLRDGTESSRLSSLVSRIQRLFT